MSPRTKKMLMIAGGIVVVGVAYSIYSSKKADAAAAAPAVPPLSPIDASIAAGARDHRTMADSELGMSQDLGSLGGAYR